MDADDLEPIKKKPAPRNLDEMSIDALNEYIAGLQAEIERAKNVIAGKQSARQGAESFFKK